MKPFKVFRTGGSIGLAAQLPTGPFNDSVITPSTALSRLLFKSDGGLDWVLSTGTVAQPDWQTGGGTGIDYTVRWDNTSGTLSAGTAGVDHPLNANVLFQVDKLGLGSKTCTGTLTIKSAGGATLATQAGVVLLAQVDP